MGKLRCWTKNCTKTATNENAEQTVATGPSPGWNQESSAQIKCRPTTYTHGQTALSDRLTAFRIWAAGTADAASCTPGAESNMATESRLPYKMRGGNSDEKQ